MRLFSASFSVLISVCATYSPSLAADEAKQPAEIAATYANTLIDESLELADEIDKIIDQRTKSGKLEEAKALRQHTQVIRLGLMPLDKVRDVKDVTIDGELKKLLDYNLRLRNAARYIAVTDYKAAIEAATKTGELSKVLELKKKIAEINEGKIDGVINLWTQEPPKPSELFLTKYLGEGGKMYLMSSKVIPQELDLSFGPNRFRISGSGRHDTVKIKRKTVGFFGKSVSIKHRIDKKNPAFKGTLRLHRPYRRGRVGYTVFLAIGRKIRSSQSLEGFKVGQNYDWSANFDGSILQMTITADDGSVVKLGTRSSGSATVGFAATVRRRRDRADLIVSYED